MPTTTPRSPRIAREPIDTKTNALNVIVETPRGSRNKFKYDERYHDIMLGSVLPAGAVFPYDFGFIPGTLADDGDPIDVLLLMDVPAFAGCVVQSRLIGVIEATQTDPKEGTVRNDRLVAVANAAHDYLNLQSLKDMDPHLLKEIEHFFFSYNELRGKKFELIAHRGPTRAAKLLQTAITKARKRSR